MLGTWEEFKGSPAKPPGASVHVTINQQGVLHFSPPAWKLLDKPEWVALFYDRINSMMGVRRVPHNRPNAFPVRSHGSSRRVHASSFCAHYGIEIERVTVFNEVEMDHEGIMRLRFRSATAGDRRRKKLANAIVNSK
ncbi:MAG: hypothetical protein ABR530_05410 [Pyrinomonadaceae bacterium]